MLDFIQFSIENNLEFILKNSYINCHAKGLHSILFINNDLMKIRLFITTKDHTLYKNDIFSEDLSIAFHPHRFDLYLKVIEGCVINTIIKQCSFEYLNSFTLNSYQYKSKLLNVEESGFKLINESLCFKLVSQIHYSKNESVKMLHNELHTISVKKDSVAAWFVFEGKEKEYYSDLAFSKSLPKLTEDLYLPMNLKFLTTLLNSINTYIYKGNKNDKTEISCLRNTF